MSRRRRGWLNDACYHITHRCHEREFYFKFAKQRDLYRLLMHEAARRYKVKILDYIVTSNHVHLLVKSRHGNEISDFLRLLHGQIAQGFNNNKQREGGFWSDRFHSTRIQDGAHLGQCLFYIDLNMVRAGAVAHPGEWEHGSYAEFTGTRKRYRIIDMEELLQSLNIDDIDEFQKWYLATLNEKMKAIGSREPYWSEAVAIGDEEYLKVAASQAQMKRYVIKEPRSGISYLIGKSIVS